MLKQVACKVSGVLGDGHGSVNERLSPLAMCGYRFNALRTLVGSAVAI